MGVELKITARRAPVRYELFGFNKKSLGFFEVVEKWEGMLKLKSDEGDTLIISEPETGAGLFSTIFGDVFSPTGSTAERTPPVPVTLHRITATLAAKATEGADELKGAKA